MDRVTLPGGVEVTPLKIIPLDAGNVMHAMKHEEDSFLGFGEAYFSSIQRSIVKGWKRHHKMTLNLVVPVGEIRFVIFDDRWDSHTRGEFFSVSLSVYNYQRLTVPPMIWMAFQGIGEGQNLLLNIANIPHDPDEEEQKTLESIPFTWN
jgi:dTDP-4-dehydrorhamnose 3,5-epimerase